MITVASSLLSYGLPGQIGAGAEKISAASATLTAQATTGLVSPDVGALGSATRLVLDLQPQLAQLGAYRQNGQVAQSRLSAAASAMTRISSIAQDLVTSLTSLSGQSGPAAESALGALSATARAQLGEVGSLLDTRSADSYVFGDGNGDVAPVTSQAEMTSGALFTAAATAAGNVDAAGAAATIQTLLSAAAATTPGATPFAASGSAAQPVEIASGVQVSTSTPLTTATTSASASSTGSGIRDLVGALSLIANLEPADVQGAQFGALLSGLSSVAASAAGGLRLQQSRIGQAQQTTNAALATNATATTTLTTRIGDLASVDVAKISTELSLSNQQLQASYMLVADLKGLSLAAYL